jgi:hypothetical protein
MKFSSRWFRLLVLCTALCHDANGSGTAGQDAPWLGWGGSVLNNRWASSNKAISTSNVNSLKLKCKLTYPQGTSAPVTIHDGIAYYPTWNGSYVALDYSTCSVKWQLNVTAMLLAWAPPTANQLNYTIPASRSSAQIDTAMGVLYFTTQMFALVAAVDLATGSVLGTTQINSHELAISTASPTLYNGVLFVGGSSVEEDVDRDLSPNYSCCTFVGNVAAFKFDRKASRFATVWDAPMLPPGSGTGNGSWSGIGVWGSQPAIDSTRNQVFFGTGNLYSLPTDVLACQKQYQNVTPSTPTPSTVVNSNPCLPKDVWQESIIALDIATGKPNWVHQIPPIDAWTLACGVAGAYERLPNTCPQEPGPDSDFGMAPVYVSGGGPAGSDVIVVGQKSGILFQMDAKTGSIIWATAAGPGGYGGGISWGVAVDQKNIFYTIGNTEAKAWKPDNITTITHSGFGAATLGGVPVWGVEAPNGGGSFIAPTRVGDVLLTGNSGDPGPFTTGLGAVFALDASNGKLLFNYTLDAIFHGGISVYDSYVMFGSGYKGEVSGSLYIMSLE